MKNAAALEQAAIRRVAAPLADAEWIRCADGAPYFETESGAPWAPVGHNEAITWPNIEPLYRRRDPHAVDRHFAMLKSHGVTCLRLMLDYSQVRNRHLETRLGQFSPAMLRLWDDLIALGEKHGIRFLLTPFDTFFMAKRWRWHPYSRHAGGHCHSPEEMFTCRDTRAAIIERMRFAVRRWGKSHAVFAWDLWNEIDSFYARGDMGAAYDFVTEISAAVREEELRLYGRAHLQTVSVYHPVLVERPAVADIVLTHPSLDFASLHLYEKGTIDFPRNSLVPAEATARLIADAAARVAPGRPLMDSEHGPIHAFNDRRITMPDEFDTACFRRAQWAHLASGGAGGGMRWPYRHPHVLLPEMHEMQSLLAGFLPLIDWRKFRREGLGERMTVERFNGVACGCGDDAQAVIALMPRNILKRPRTELKLAGFAPGAYRLTVMDTVTGEREVQQVEHAGGTLDLAITAPGDVVMALTKANAAAA